MTYRGYRPASKREKRLYRVVVDTAPEGEVQRQDGPLDDDSTISFITGQSRTYQSFAAAENKLAWWVLHGCVVHIDISEPIVWMGEQ